MSRIETIGILQPAYLPWLGFFEQIFSNIGRFSGAGPAQPGN